MKTKVIFRKWQGEIIALFPEEPGDSSPHTCSSYMHVGQHGAADISGILMKSKPAKPSEYSELAAELKKVGYNLEVVKRNLRSFYQARKNKLK